MQSQPLNKILLTSFLKHDDFILLMRNFNPSYVYKITSNKTKYSLVTTWEFLLPGPIHPVSDDIRSFAGTSYPPVAKSNEGCPQKAPYVKTLSSF
jgi:hypothetical protein